MSKIFCEVCGTAYSYTAEKCPICGCPKPASAEFSVESEGLEETSSRTAVKGGRFSKENVDKRLNAEPVREPKPRAAKSVPTKPAAQQKRKKKTASNAEKALIIIIICLIVAIVVVIGYILLNYLIPRQPSAATQYPTEQTTVAPTTENTVPPTTEEQEIACTDLTLTEEVVLLNEIGGTWLLHVVPTPADTTDKVTYVSSNPAVATVSADGLVTAVADGECTITVTCGDVSATCQVFCEIEEPTEPTETEPPETKPQYVFKFNTNFKSDYYDAEVSMPIGYVWLAYDGEIDMSEIEWSVGNASIATVKDGIVRVIAAGTTVLKAVYNGVEYTCLLRCG